MLLRLIPLPVHGALELTLGMAVAAAPFALGLGAAGIVAGVFLGTTLMGLALGAGVGDGAGAVSLAAHAAYDRALAVGLLGAGALTALAAEPRAAALFAAAGLAQLALIAVTRYSRSA